MTVYFIECAGRIKIGYTGADAESRLRSLSTGSAHDLNLILEIVGSVHLERAIHRRLKPYRQRGEWFNDCPEVRELIELLRAEGSAIIDYVDPPPREKYIPSIRVDPFEAPTAPIYRRIHACLDRYFGEAVRAVRDEERSAGLPEGTLVNERIGGYYTVNRSSWAMAMCKHTSESLSGLYEPAKAALASFDFEQRDLVSRGTFYAERLEQGLQKLFENPDVGMLDLSAYQGVTVKEAA